MADQHPQDQPKPVPGEAGRDWNEVSAQEVEQTLTNAAELAYELAGHMGVASNQPKFRDTSELQAIETALDTELKQIDHLVSKTKEELGESVSSSDVTVEPASLTTTTKPLPSVPDFMAEFMSDEPVTVLPESSRLEPDSRSENTAGASPIAVDPIPGLVGVGSLGRHKAQNPPKPEQKASQRNPDAPPREPLWAKLLGKPVFLVCQGAVTMLEIMDRPLNKLSSRSRRALHVTALAAFCVCVIMFVLSLMFS